MKRVTVTRGDGTGYAVYAGRSLTVLHIEPLDQLHILGIDIPISDTRSVVFKHGEWRGFDLHVDAAPAGSSLYEECLVTADAEVRIGGTLTTNKGFV